MGISGALLTDQEQAKRDAVPTQREAAVTDS